MFLEFWSQSHGHCGIYGDPHLTKNNLGFLWALMITLSQPVVRGQSYSGSTFSWPLEKTYLFSDTPKVTNHSDGKANWISVSYPHCSLLCFSGLSCNVIASDLHPPQSGLDGLLSVPITHHGSCGMAFPTHEYNHLLPLLKITSSSKMETESVHHYIPSALHMVATQWTLV